VSLVLGTTCVHGPITPFIADTHGDQNWNNCGGNNSSGGAQVIRGTDVACGLDYNSQSLPVLAQEMTGVYYPSGEDLSNHPNAFALINRAGDLAIVMLEEHQDVHASSISTRKSTMSWAFGSICRPTWSSLAVRRNWSSSDRPSTAPEAGRWTRCQTGTLPR